MRLLVVAWYTISCREGRGQPPGAWGTGGARCPRPPDSGTFCPLAPEKWGWAWRRCLSFQPMGGCPPERALRTPEMPPPQLAAGPQPRGRIASAPRDDGPQVGKTGVPGRVSASPRLFLTPDGLPVPPSSSRGATCRACRGGARGGWRLHTDPGASMREAMHMPGRRGHTCPHGATGGGSQGASSAGQAAGSWQVL